jgi:hypothetical protein
MHYYWAPHPGWGSLQEPDGPSGPLPHVSRVGAGWPRAACEPHAPCAHNTAPTALARAAGHGAQIPVPPEAMLEGRSLVPILEHGVDPGRLNRVISQFHGDEIHLSWFMLRKRWPRMPLAVGSCVTCAAWAGPLSSRPRQLQVCDLWERPGSEASPLRHEFGPVGREGPHRPVPAGTPTPPRRPRAMCRGSPANVG